MEKFVDKAKSQLKQYNSTYEYVVPKSAIIPKSAIRPINVPKIN